MHPEHDLQKEALDDVLIGCIQFYQVYKTFGWTEPKQRPVLPFAGTDPEDWAHTVSNLGMSMQPLR